MCQVLIQGEYSRKPRQSAAAFMVWGQQTVSKTENRYGTLPGERGYESPDRGRARLVGHRPLGAGLLQGGWKDVFERVI